jgi:hypothetical protein
LIITPPGRRAGKRARRTDVILASVIFESFESPLCKGKSAPAWAGADLEAPRQDHRQQPVLPDST